MMERIWDDILRRFGQPVVLKQNGRTTALQALIQPLSAQSQEQERPGPLGLGRRDLFRYMGPAGCPLELDALVEWQGRDYRVQSAHLVGGGVCPSWRATLTRRDEVGL